MLVPKRDAKSYGAVYIDNYMDFIGFCKKVYSDEIQCVDVFLDGNKIDTITANKNILKIEQMYDMEGFGFEYELQEIHHDKQHTLSFRCSNDGEELVNSPIAPLHKKNSQYTEYKFWHNAIKFTDNNNINTNDNLHDSVSFMLTEKTLEDKDFIEIIKTFHNDHNARIVCFYFQEALKQKISNTLDFEIEFIIPSCVDDISKHSSVYLHSSISRKDEIKAYYVLNKVLASKVKNIFVVEIKNKLQNNLFDSIEINIDKVLEIEKSILWKIIPEEKQNEFKFINSLSNPIDEDKIKDMYCPNSIGFLATEENLADVEFVGYIKELMVRFPDVEFKCFYFNNTQQKHCLSIFKSDIQLLIPENIYDLVSQVEIYIFNNTYPNSFRELFYKIRFYASRVFSVQLIQKDKESTLGTATPNHPCLLYNNQYGFTNKELNEANGSGNMLIYSKLSSDFCTQTNLFECKYYSIIPLLLNNNQVKSYLYNIHKMHFTILKIRI